MGYSKRFSTTITTGLTVTLNLGPLSRMPADGRVTAYCSTSAVGVLVTMMVGTDVVDDSSEVNVAATAGRIEVPADLAASGKGLANDPITIRLFNSTGGTLVIATLVQIE